MATLAKTRKPTATVKVKTDCSCGRAAQFLIKHGHTRAQRRVAVCGLHASDGLRAFASVGENTEVTVTVLR